MSIAIATSWRRPVVWAAIPIFFGAGTATDSLAVVLPQIRGEYDVHLHELLWVSVSFLLIQAVVLPVAGRVGDRIGRRPVFMAGLAVVALGSAASVAAPGHGWLVAARIIAGVGAGLLLSGSLAIVRDAVPVETLGRAFGLYSMVVGLGVLVVPLINGTLTHYVSWRWIMALTAVVSVVALMLTPRFIPGGRPSAIVRPSIGRVLRSANYIAASAMTGLASVVLGMMFFTLAFNHHTGAEFTSRDIGLSFAAYGVFYLALSPFAGRLADRIGVRPPLLIGAALMFFSMVLFSISHSLNHMAATTVALAVIGAGIAFLAPAANTAAFGRIQIEDRSDASALNWMLRLIGSAVGVVIAVLFLESFGSTTKPEFGVDAGFGDASVWVWVVGAVISLVAAIVTLVGIRTSEKGEIPVNGPLGPQ